MDTRHTSVVTADTQPWALLPQRTMRVGVCRFFRLGVGMVLTEDLTVGIEASSSSDEFFGTPGAELPWEGFGAHAYGRIHWSAYRDDRGLVTSWPALRR